MRPLSQITYHFLLVIVIFLIFSFVNSYVLSICLFLVVCICLCGRLVSPYLKSLSMVASTKLLHLLEVCHLSQPSCFHFFNCFIKTEPVILWDIFVIRQTIYSLMFSLTLKYTYIWFLFKILMLSVYLYVYV